MKKTYNILTEGFLEDEDTIIDRILDARKIQDPYHFLNPNDDDLLPYETLTNFDQARQVMAAALKNSNTHYYLSVDSDTDGVTSGAIMYRWLRANGAENISYFVSQGKTHGLSADLVEDVRKKKPDLLIVMDSLDSTIDHYREVSEMGIQVIVLDHHDVSPDIPYEKYVTLVSSYNTANPFLSGAGVVWKFCCSLDEDDFTFNCLADLAAVGLVADVMDMSEDSMENRFIVSHGLNSRCSRAIEKIIGSYQFNSNSIVFSIAPLINAACRYFENDTAFEMFISDDDRVISRCLKVLKNCKEQQNIDVRAIKSELSQHIEEQKDYPFLFLPIETEWGISGLIANQILNQFKKPTFVVRKRNGMFSGSGRAAGINLREICNEIVPTARGMGHPQAFGFEVSPEYIYSFHESMIKALEEISFDFSDDIDCELATEDVTRELINGVRMIDWITGEGFRPLKFLIREESMSVRTMTNGKHLVFESADGMLFIKWNAGNQMENYADKTRFCFTGTLDAGYFGRKWSRRMIVDSVEAIE